MGTVEAASGDRLILAEKVMQVIDAGVDGDREVFEPLALELFAYQYANNEPYRAYCDAAGASPDNVTRWLDVPAYPTQAFKEDIGTSFPVSEAVMGQITSGTTSANQRRRIFRDEIGRELIFSANRVMTGAYCFPDFESGQRCRILILAPSPQLAPGMGMAVGMEQTREHFGTPDSRFLLGRTGVDVAGLVDSLRDAEKTGEPVALIGATSAFVYFFNACQKKRVSFLLPSGSRLIDGGGYRGRFGDVTRDDYYRLAAGVLGVPESHCVNTLGMAESATNYADRTLRDCVAGVSDRPRRKVPPPWTRVVAVCPTTGTPCDPGVHGLLVHYDLANLPTVMGVQTDNLGFVDEDGSFEIIGRAKVVDGRVSERPSERTVGPMGDRSTFRLLEAYVNFSIQFKMGHLTSAQKRVSHLEDRRERETAAGRLAEEVVASCPTVVDDLVAAADDPDAARASAAALAEYRKQAAESGDIESAAVPGEGVGARVGE